jgi:hypothetical protein
MFKDHCAYCGNRMGGPFDTPASRRLAGACANCGTDAARENVYGEKATPKHFDRCLHSEPTPCRKRHKHQGVSITPRMREDDVRVSTVPARSRV